MRWNKGIAWSLKLSWLWEFMASVMFLCGILPCQMVAARSVAGGVSSFIKVAAIGQPCHKCRPTPSQEHRPSTLSCWQSQQLKVLERAKLPMNSVEKRNQQQLRQRRDCLKMTLLRNRSRFLHVCRLLFWLYNTIPSDPTRSQLCYCCTQPDHLQGQCPTMRGCFTCAGQACYI